MNTALWAITRATALTSIVLLTATVVLGCLTTAQAGRDRHMRSVRTAVHRTLSLVLVCFLVVHVLTAVIETYVDIGWLSVLVPFTAGYETFWIGIGTIALDLMIAIIVTSLLRHRLPVRGWRLVHRAAYALWPLALMHAVFSASVDTRLVLVVDAVCAVAGLAAIGYRVVVTTADTRRRRLFSDGRPTPSTAPAHRHPAVSSGRARA